MFRLVSQFIGLLIGLLIKLVLAVIFYGTPLVGFWLASSLAAYLGGPHYLAWTAGLLLFPIIPGLWELRAWANRRPDSKAFLTPLDRLSLRTFVVGLAFLAVLICLYPQTAFVSLSTRGDWMLDDVKDSRADSARRYLFRAAGALEWLYRYSKTNPYKDHIDQKARQLAEEAAREREQEVAKQKEKEAQQSEKVAEQQSDKIAEQQGDKTAEQQGDKIAEQQREKDANQQGEIDAEPENVAAPTPEQKWPWRGQTLHPAVKKLPASAETSIKSVAHYIAKQEKDPVQRIKALHDYVADRIAYDSEALYSGNIPDQGAETTFKTRKSVCAGYANLLSALAAAINEKIIVVTGDARDSDNGDNLTGNGHAWNAARIKNRWYLIDACWDAGYVSREKGFTKEYKIDYLLPPPEVMIQDHFPEDPNWQLLGKPLSQGEFLRQPMLNPSFQEAGLTLVSPCRACNETGGQALVVLKNPSKRWLMAGLERNGQDLKLESKSTNDETARLEYSLPGKGTYRFNLFEGPKQYGSYSCVGSVDFVNR